MTKILSETSISNVGVFALLNLWNFTCVGVVALLYTQIFFGESPQTNKRFRLSVHPSRFIRATVRHVASGVKVLFQSLFVGRSFSSPITTVHRAGWWSLLRCLIFVTQILVIALLLRQLLSLAFLSGTGSDSAYTSGLDVQTTLPTLSAAAKTLSPNAVFFMVNYVIGSVILLLAWTWVSLLRPAANASLPLFHSQGGTGQKGSSRWRQVGVLARLGWLPRILVLATFTGFVIFFNRISASAMEKGVSQSVIFIAANVVFILLLPPVGWALLGLLRGLGKLRGSFSFCKA
ncbi:hypothetical protein BCR39DRAFT_545213 [Naematelia encephala]|uniref:Uncharacterized protein n=1 Tax=Naematelia encephala TaxID=71784 RepID=A0A1Y2AS87_9TREE|nr:hypothetical protein BCR39DRAFT_545213 [Naematelia encephala]